MSVRARLARGTAWISAAGLVTNALGLLSTLLLARLLSPADFGLVALATTLLALIASITELSLSSALVHHADPKADHYSTAFTISAVRGTILAALLVASAHLIALFYHDRRLLPIMLAFAGGTFISGLQNPRAILLSKNLIFWQEFLLQVGGRLVGLIASVTIAFAFHSYWALVWGTLATQLFSVALSYIIMPFWPRFTLVHGKELFSFSIWLSFGQIINTINWNIDQFVVGTYISKIALGFYTVGNNLAVMPSREVTKPITSTLFPAYAQLRDDKPRLAAAYQSSQALVTSIALPAGVGMSLVARPMIAVVMGAKWMPAVFLIQVLASVFAFQTLGTLSQPLAMAMGETRLLFKRDLQSFVMRVPMIIAGLLLGGLNGIIWARLMTGSLVIVFHMLVVKHITDLSLSQQLKGNLRSLASVGVMAAAVLCASHALRPIEQHHLGYTIELASLISLGAITYVGTHAAFWLFAGRPDGPEQFVLGVGQRFLGRFGLSRA